MLRPAWPPPSTWPACRGAGWTGSANTRDRT